MFNFQLYICSIGYADCRNLAACLHRGKSEGFPFFMLCSISNLLKFYSLFLFPFPDQEKQSMF